MNAEIRTTAAPQSHFPLLPVSLFVLAWIGLPLSVIGVFFHPFLPGGWLSISGALLLVAIPLRALVNGFTREAYPNASTRLFIMRPFWYAMLALPLIAIGMLTGAALGFPFGDSAQFARWSTAITIPGLSLLSIMGWYHSRKLTLKVIDVSISRLPEAFEGLKIVQISDLHVGPHTSKPFLAKIQQTVLNQQPDLIVITGDQVDDFAHDIEHFNAAFKDLEAPCGVYAVIGNHDIYANWIPVKAGLESSGIQVLLNESKSIEKDGQRIWIAGTGDPAANKNNPLQAPAAPDISLTFKDISPNEPVIALAHNPALWSELNQRGVDLTLSGHTHYGQFAIPFLNWSLASPFLEHAMGLYKKGTSTLYINPGTGFWGVPFRFGTPAEVSVIRLSSRK
ncbi:MAG: metallophosphoesterase [Opitutales bacterium]